MTMLGPFSVSKEKQASDQHRYSEQPSSDYRKIAPTKSTLQGYIQIRRILRPSPSNSWRRAALLCFSGFPRLKRKLCNHKQSESAECKGFSLRPTNISSASQAHYTEMAANQCALNNIVARPRARILLTILAAIGWVLWGAVLAQVVLTKPAGYIALLVVLGLIAAQLGLIAIGIYNKTLYHAPWIMGVSIGITIVYTSIAVFILGDDIVFWTAMGLIIILVVFWIAFSTNYKSRLAAPLQPFGLEPIKLNVDMVDADKVVMPATMLQSSPSSMFSQPSDPARPEELEMTSIPTTADTIDVS